MSGRIRIFAVTTEDNIKVGGWDVRVEWTDDTWNELTTLSDMRAIRDWGKNQPAAIDAVRRAVGRGIALSSSMALDILERGQYNHNWGEWPRHLLGPDDY